MIADVPLGVFLSGGIDSTTVTALMQAQSSVPIRTFTIGFEEETYDEARHAHEIARFLGTDHTELYVTPQDALDVIPRLPTMYDEPFSDSSQIPTFLVAAMARKHVTVCLSGDGGDEVFGGYSRYFWGQSFWKYSQFIPRSMRSVLRKGVQSIAPKQWDGLARGLSMLLPRLGRMKDVGTRLHRVADVITATDMQEVYKTLISHWADPAVIVRGADEPRTRIDTSRWIGLTSSTEWMMATDLITYLPDDVLAKVDRASMAVSLEAREPLLDHRIIEFAWRLPLAFKVGRGSGKLILRRLLARYVPAALIDRPKMGFDVPVGAWLRGPLRDWAESLLSEDRLRGEGFLEPSPIRSMWAAHVSGRRDWDHHLWDVLMFQAWLETNHSRRSVSAEAQTSSCGGRG
jgi:asparagine synthase (glutamine-hydrolysing)